MNELASQSLTQGTGIEQADQVFPVVPPPRMAPHTAQLVLSRGPGTGTGFPLGAARITIGRHPDNDIALGDTTVSGEHAEIRVDGDRYLIADVGSFTGTYVNRQQVDRAELRDGDEVWIGRHRMRFRHAKPTR
jgi:pSer/pThr/pTyr-binding forkhead associated (FHA) protein